MPNSHEMHFINSTQSRMLLVLEPRSSEFWIDSGATVRLLVKALSAQSALDVEYMPGGLVVYARDAGQFEVYQNGIRLAQGRQTRRMADKLMR